MLALALAALTIGQTAPSISLPATTGSTVEVAQYRGKQAVLLAFFPAVFSPGCTAQLKGYRDEFSQFTRAKVQVLAISTDTPFSQKAFADAYELPFPLLSDQEGKAMAAYEVPKIEDHYAARQVFLIDRFGNLAYVDRAYQVGKSEKALHAAIDKLGR